MNLEMELLQEKLAVIKFSLDTQIPDWVWQSKIYSITKTEDELSIIAEQTLIPFDTACEFDWRVIRVKGEYPISLVGLVSHVSGIFAKHGICIFPLSTYGTDHYLVKDKDVTKAFIAFREANIKINE